MKTKFLILCSVLLLSSCLGTKKTTERTNVTKTEKSTTLKKDSLRSEVVNKGISDNVSIPVVKSKTNDRYVDSLVNAKVSETLSKLNFSKKSGSNGYTLSYNQLKDLIEVGVTVGETKNVSQEVKSELEDKQTDTQIISEYIKKVRGIPIIWFILAILFVFRKQILGVASFFYPPLKFTKFFAFATSTTRTRNVELQVKEQNQLIRDMFNDLKNEIHDIKNPL